MLAFIGNLVRGYKCGADRWRQLMQWLIEVTRDQNIALAAGSIALTVMAVMASPKQSITSSTRSHAARTLFLTLRATVRLSNTSKLCSSTDS
eukprot:COSAG05_NODE_20980_length_275_cov_0.823864_1_plen_91_part_11